MNNGKDDHFGPAYDVEQAVIGKAAQPGSAHVSEPHAMMERFDFQPARRFRNLRLESTSQTFFVEFTPTRSLDLVENGSLSGANGEFDPKPPVPERSSPQW
jgi:hypothetical protein